MSERRLVAEAALGFAAAVTYSFVLLIFTVMMLPSSGPPAEAAAINSSFFFWLVGAGSIWLLFVLPRRDPLIGLSVCVVATVVQLALAGWIGPRFERARLDSCFWGQGGGEQSWCFPERDALPEVTQAWYGAALVTSLVLGLALAWRTSGRSKRDALAERLLPGA